MKEILLTELPIELHNLPIPDRLTLVTALWDSIVDDDAALELTDDQKAELDRRLELRANRPASGKPWAEVRQRILGK
jgi:putative addiction module component (TIGR02574 family)